MENVMSAALVFFIFMVVAAYLALLVYLFRQRRRIAFSLALIPLAAAVWIVLGWKPIYVTRLPKFAEDVKRVIQPQALQKWAVAKIKSADRNADASLIPSEQVPAALRNLQSQGSDFHGAIYYLGELGIGASWWARRASGMATMPITSNGSPAFTSGTIRNEMNSTPLHPVL
jgi:hypothetical protein